MKQEGRQFFGTFLETVNRQENKEKIIGSMPNDSVTFELLKYKTVEILFEVSKLVL